jgi:opine dehydrogenase
MADKIRVAVIGAGHGGRAIAADMASRGVPVKLFNRTWAHVETIALRGGIDLEQEDDSVCFGPLELVTSDIGEALRDVELIMVVVPASGHADVARYCAPHLRDGQTVVLNPGRTGGALEFAAVLHQEGCAADINLAEASTLIFASRSLGPAQSKIFRIKNSVPLAALPATRTPDVLKLLNQVYPQFVHARNVIYTSLDNMGAIFHPALTLLNAGRIESTQGNFQFYVEGVTPSVAHVLEVLDRERVTVAASLGVRANTALEWLQMAYAATGENLYEAMQDNPGYRGIDAPRSIHHRYILEDVPMSLVPIASLGRSYGVSTPAIDAIIQLACIMHGTDYWRRGRTVEKLGLSGLRVSEVRRFVEEGVLES